ncbi:MAG: hypothetical protein KDJ65_15840 [Anaerolineae bacterium]|nr:hypothetical protein [Anaerolineae bacterium]
MKHSQVQTLNHRPRTYPELVKSSAMSEQDAAYYAALDLVARIDEDLTRGIRHYRTKAGLLLTTLDEVIQAILEDNLLTQNNHQNEMAWTQELAA